MQNRFVRSIAWDLVWTFLTCGLYNIYIQSEQIKATNEMLRQEKYSFWPWLIFTILTCGIYHVYHEYRMTLDLCQLSGRENATEALICAAFAGFGLHIIADCIQQTYINQYYGSTKL